MLKALAYQFSIDITNENPFESQGFYPIVRQDYAQFIILTFSSKIIPNAI